MSRIDKQALDWAMKHAAGRLSDAEASAFEAWYDSSERNQGAYLRAQAILHSVDKIAIQSDLRPTALEAGSSKSAKPISKLSRRNLLLGGTAGSIAAGFAFIALKQPFNARVLLNTATGEVRNVPLADRSIANLNSASQIEVSMTPKLRRIVLVEGEAVFDVAKNPERPFVVEAGNVRVRAVGTAFGVRKREGGADVFVTEGVVEVWRENGISDRQQIRAGQSAYITEAGHSIAVSSAPEEVERRLAWREGKLILNNNTLTEAVTEFNRYNEVKMVIADPAIRDHRFVGQYRMDQPEDFADTVHALLDVPVSKDAQEIVLGSRPAAAKPKTGG